MTIVPTLISRVSILKFFIGDSTTTAPGGNVGTGVGGAGVGSGVAKPQANGKHAIATNNRLRYFDMYSSNVGYSYSS